MSDWRPLVLFSGSLFSGCAAAALLFLFGNSPPARSAAPEPVPVAGNQITADCPREQIPAELGGAGATPLSPPEALKISPSIPRIAGGQEFFKGAHYVGAETCKECHQLQYDDWRRMWHSKMERWATPENVIGCFDGRVITYDKIVLADGKTSPSVMPSREGDKFYMTLLDKKDPSKNVKYEIAKTLGGKWDQHYEVKDANGRYYPTPMRWSVQAGDWLIEDFPPAYHPSAWFEADGTPKRQPPADRAAEGRCAGCHTTGYEFKKVNGLWQATGNGELGIACERCHGPASKHIDEAKAAKARGETKLPNSTIANPLKDLTTFQQTQICGQCHGRAFNKQTPEDLFFQMGFIVGDTDITDHYNYWNYSSFSLDHRSHVTDYFWHNDWAKKNRQQWQDFTKSAHYTTGGMSCLTCHTFHGKWEGPQLRLKNEEICTSCHVKDSVAAKPNKEMYEGSKHQATKKLANGVTCVNCHMPRIGKRSGGTAKGPAPWDVSSHTFLMATPFLEKTIGMRTACSNCHLGKDPPGGPLSLAELDLELRKTKEFTRDNLEKLAKDVTKLHRAIDGLPPDLTQAQRAAIEQAILHIARADQNLGDIVRDGSFGFHNKEKSREMLRRADDWLACAEVCIAERKCNDSDHMKENPNGMAGKCYEQIGTKK
jgi:predicted CXXCH cytochrome family protein